jgi:hypothetical protein
VNALRRFLLVLHALLLLGVVGGLISLAWDQDEQLDLNISDLNVQAFVEAGDNAKYAFTAVLGLIALVALISLLVALWPQREGRRGALKIKQTDGGFVEVTPGAIEALLRDELEALPEVRRANPRVRLNGGAIDTHVDADIEPSASIAHITKVLSSTVDSTLREHVGVTSARRPVIRINYDEAAARPIPGRRVRPAPPPEPGPYTPGYQSANYPDDRAGGPGFRPQQSAVTEPEPAEIGDGGVATATESRRDVPDPRPEVAPAPDMITEVPDAARPPEAPRFVSSAEEVPPHDDRS